MVRRRNIPYRVLRRVMASAYVKRFLSRNFRYPGDRLQRRYRRYRRRNYREDRDWETL